MGKTSELGPVDPQWLIEENSNAKIYSVYRMVQNYKTLFDEAVKTKGNIQPFLQQLSTYDPRDIADYETALETADDIAIKALKSGVLAGRTEDQIKGDVEMFLKPETVKTHGRAIYAADAQKCGLNVDLRNPDDTLWKKVYELFMRLNNFVSRNKITKCIETVEYSYVAGA